MNKFQINLMANTITFSLICLMFHLGVAYG